MKEWKYNNPEFECDKLNYELLRFAPWSGHRNFAYDLTAWLKPKNITELGSHYGCSAFTFVQAAKDNKLDSSMYFVDTWQGDDFTKKYDNDVFTVFSRTVEEYYSGQNVNMLRMTFDEAREKFEDGSIDLLHIDGSHHYEDVKRDFETWRSKVKDTGIIMLHDVSSDIVLGDIMGSYRYWQELKKEYSYTLEFDFSWGLGVIFLDPQIYDRFCASGFEAARYQRINNSLDVEYKDFLRKNYFEIRDKQMYIDDLLRQKDILNSQIEAYKTDNEKIKTDYKEEAGNVAAAFERERADIIRNYEENTRRTIRDYEENIQRTIEDYEKNIEEIKKSYTLTIEEKDNYISELLGIKARYEKLPEIRLIKSIKKIRSSAPSRTKGKATK